jgi:hypothetical protein
LSETTDSQSKSDKLRLKADFAAIKFRKIGKKIAIAILKVIVQPRERLCLQSEPEFA